MTESTTHHRRTTRRQFAAATALSLAAPLTAAGADPQKAQPGRADPFTAAVDGLAAMVQARYGKSLTPEELRGVRPSTARGQETAERMKQVKLTNADEPAFLFQAD